jgi:hypothetical protein
MMKKTIKEIEQTIKLPMTIHSNIHGLELVEASTFCENCSDLHVDYMLRLSFMELFIYLEEEEYESFVECGIDGYTVESFYDLYNDRHCLYVEDFRFIMLDTENNENVASVAKIDGESILEIHYKQERFNCIQDILDYTEVDFEEDFNSGEFETQVIERRKK